MRDQPARVQAGPAATTRPDQASLLGQVAWLMMQSPVHRHLFLADLEYRVAPPLMLQQFRLYRRDNVPVAFVSWALLTEEVEKRVQRDRKSTRLNSSHGSISYAVFCLKKKKKDDRINPTSTTIHRTLTKRYNEAH